MAVAITLLGGAASTTSSAAPILNLGVAADVSGALLFFCAYIGDSTDINGFFTSMDVRFDGGTWRNTTHASFGGPKAETGSVQDTGPGPETQGRIYWINPSAYSVSSFSTLEIRINTNTDGVDYIAGRVYKVTGANMTTPVDAVVVPSKTTTTSIAGTLAISTNGGGLGMHLMEGGGGSVAWTNLTEDYDGSGDTYLWGVASSVSAGSATRTATVSGTSTPRKNALILVGIASAPPNTINGQMFAGCEV